eukprot:5132230-Prorocentrum_lima.AAC.1
MTSSLVGSEMCIRDRPNATTRAGAGSGGRQAECKAHCQEDKPPTMTPVSYTHLTLPTICSV